MYKYAQVLYGKAHWIFETEDDMEILRTKYEPKIVFIDVTDIQPEPKEGWLYDSVNNIFYPSTSLIGDINKDTEFKGKIEIKKQLINKDYSYKLRQLKDDFILSLLSNDTNKQEELKISFNDLNQEYAMKLSAFSLLGEA